MDWRKGDIRVYYLEAMVEFHPIKYIFVGSFNLDCCAIIFSTRGTYDFPKDFMELHRLC